MKKKSSSRIGRVFKSVINVRYWADWDRVKAFTTSLYNGIVRMFVPSKTTSDETFDQAIARLNITETDLDLKQKALFQLSMVMVAAAALILFYTGYQLFWGSFKAALISLVVMMIALVLAFRYHFWYFQIKKRKLGCTYEEWYKQGLLGEKE
ncbi:MAG: type IV secretion protein IcmV [Legionella sp.]|nr:MAG: type IV secretion protein IcmV [Legionella sp.]